ncbi:hypothetical protein TRFO_18250 [Tritrichomonas foetus]|uniref:Bromo domain-containing protein n=1 Tax=Tritrichomonas foetus TaxID=1144522 RepID=A0A1J4KM94_9EUKA|nr:hypothetical protein TRFO_18250 [Tritrichomonas foetus]|eukprot:OHT12056.1 hypothetical protein TRFO_18250 [Tritrichomonas foetus]
MNQQTLLKCEKLMLKLENRPMYQYFLCFKNNKSKRKFLDLFQIKNKLTLNEYSSMNDWLDDLTRFFKEVIDHKRSSILQRHAAQSLLEIINKKSKRIKCLDIDDWVSVYSHTYQEMASLIAESPPELNISKMARPMQLAGTAITFSEHDLIEIRQILEKKLDDKSKKIVAQLIIALEPNVVSDLNSVEFDLARLSNETLLAVRSFLKTCNAIHTPVKPINIELF